MPMQSILVPEQRLMLADMINRKYVSSRGNRYFEVDVHRDGDTLHVCVTLRDRNGSYVYPVEARMNMSEQDLSLTDARDLLLDYIDAYFEEYLTGEQDVYLTLDWSNYECDGLDLQMRGQIVREDLEKMADELLARGDQGSLLH